MSNHHGSYMLNDILKLLDQSSVFEALGRQRTQTLVLEIIKISLDDDCNPGEILKGLGERLGVCYYCREPANEFDDNVDICKECSTRTFDYS